MRNTPVIDFTDNNFETAYYAQLLLHIFFF